MKFKWRLEISGEVIFDPILLAWPMTYGPNSFLSFILCCHVDGEVGTRFRATNWFTKGACESRPRNEKPWRGWVSLSVGRSSGNADGGRVSSACRIGSSVRAVRRSISRPTRARAPE
jgi:hypothetical protein